MPSLRKFSEVDCLAAVLTAGLLLAFLSSPAVGDELHAYRKDATVDYSECTGDEVTECISHSLSCSEFGAPFFTIIVGPVEQIAARLIAGTEGEAEGALLLAGGSSEIVTVTSIEVVANELDGGWILTLGISNGDEVLSAMTASNSEGAYLEVGGERFSLAPQPGDGGTLMEWKAACGGYGELATDVAGSWIKYGNARFGYWIELPPGFSGLEEAPNGDGGASKSADGKADLSVWGSYLSEGNFESEVKDRIELTSAYGWKVTYQKREGSWASWSATKGDRIMYERAIELCNSASAFFLLEYDARDVAEFDSLIERLVASFKQGTCN